MQQLVVHGAAIDEEELVRRIAAREGGQAGKAGNANALALLIDLQRIVAEIRAQHGGHARLAGLATLAPFCRDCQALAAIQGEEEADIGPRHGEAFDDVGHRRVLAALALEEFQAGGGGVEKVAHLDPRAAPPQRCRRGDAMGLAALDRDGVGITRAAWLAGDRQAGDGADGGQCLAAKAHGGDVEQVVLSVFAHG